jgi:hypothetical protein
LLEALLADNLLQKRLVGTGIETLPATLSNFGESPPGVGEKAKDKMLIADKHVCQFYRSLYVSFFLPIEDKYKRATGIYQVTYMTLLVLSPVCVADAKFSE